MKRGSKFLIGLAAAALTFGSLWAFVGPKRGHCERWQHHGYSHERYHHGCPQHEWGDKATESPKDKPTL